MTISSSWQVIVQANEQAAASASACQHQQRCQKDRAHGENLGGYLAPRAAAFEDRLATCIADDGVYDYAMPDCRFCRIIIALPILSNCGRSSPRCKGSASAGPKRRRHREDCFDILGRSSSLKAALRHSVNERGQLQPTDREDTAQLLDRIRVLVDSHVESRISFWTVDTKRGGLFAPLITSGGIAGFKGAH
jgi:hypothetical protein